MKRIVLLGSTGSIGRSALEVIGALGPDYLVVGLSADRRWEAIAAQIDMFRPSAVAMACVECAEQLRQHLQGRASTRVLAGPQGVEELAALEEADFVVHGISGAAGLAPALAAIRAGKTLALANKECLVMAGQLVNRLARETGVQIIPLDSEHSGVFQTLRAGRPAEIRKVILTASGGPFLRTPASKLASVTPAEALRHPNWSMGQKITIDSATMMNKALEVIEARWLFDLKVNQIEVLVHPESIVHSIVEFRDGACLAQMGPPDMRVPIQYGLTYPERMNGQPRHLNLAKLGKLSFMEPDVERFPALRLGYRAAEQGGTLGAVLNAANETAVAGFLAGRIRFIDIPRLVEHVMELHNVTSEPGLDEILAADRWARQEAERCLT